MKNYTGGLVLAAILMVVAGFGIGIAQAAGTHSDAPVLTLEDQSVLEQGSTSSWKDVDLLVETGNMPEPSGADSAIVTAEGDMYRDAQLRNPIETGSLPGRSDENDLDHSNVPSEGNIHQYWGSDNPSS